MLWYVLLLVLITFLYLKLIRPNSSFWAGKNVRYKKGWPIIGNLGPILFRQKTFAEFLKDLYNECPGRYLGVYQFLTPMLFVKDLELLKRITIKDFDSFIDHKGFVSEKVDPLFGHNLFSLKGSKWRNMRTTFSPAFTGSKMRSMHVLMSKCAEKCMNYMEEECGSYKERMEIKIGDVITRYVNDAIATCAFGIECDSFRDKHNDFYVTGRESLRFDGVKGLLFFAYALSPRLMEFFNLRFINEQASDFYRKIVRETMRKREEDGIFRPDMINLLMEAKKGSLKFDESQDDDVGFATVGESDIVKDPIRTEEILTNDVLTSQALVFFLAGFEAITESMKFLSYELITNPEIQQKLQEEIDATLEEHNVINYEVIKKMKYLDMVVSELFRKWPVATILDRVCTKPYTIKAVDSEENDIHLEIGDCVWVPIFAIHHDPMYYPNPDRFDPERFSEENKKNINPYAYLPFGLGPRNCIGNRFALMEIKTFFVHLLKHFNLVVTSKTEIPLKVSKITPGLHISDIYLGLSLR